MELVHVPGGVSFWMGTAVEDIPRLLAMARTYRSDLPGDVFDHETPRRQENIPKDFWMGKYEITQQQWRVVAEQLPQIRLALSPQPSRSNQGNNYPVENIAFNECLEFCGRLSVAVGRRCSLPTETKWEYAARAESAESFSWGDTLEGAEVYANCADSSFPSEMGEEKSIDGSLVASWSDGFPRTAPVGSFQPNGFGLYDMFGNVGEWCLFHGEAPRRKKFRFYRGGSWGHGPMALRPPSRRRAAPKSPPSGYVGFRVLVSE